MDASVRSSCSRKLELISLVELELGCTCAALALDDADLCNFQSKLCVLTLEAAGCRSIPPPISEFPIVKAGGPLGGGPKSTALLSSVPWLEEVDAVLVTLIASPSSLATLVNEASLSRLRFVFGGDDSAVFRSFAVSFAWLIKLVNEPSLSKLGCDFGRLSIEMPPPVSEFWSRNEGGASGGGPSNATASFPLRSSGLFVFLLASASL